MTDEEIKKVGSLSLQKLDELRGARKPSFLADPPTETDGWVWWMYNVYDKPFAELDDADLTQFCRQGWEREYVIPVALARLQNNPFIGQYSDGELILYVGEAPPKFWEDHPDYRKILYEILERIIGVLQSRTSIDEPLEEFPAVGIYEDFQNNIMRLWEHRLLPPPEPRLPPSV